MGTSDGAEVCELIGISMVDTSGPEAEKLKKKFQKLFKDLDIIVQCNLKITNLLDITLNLTMVHTALIENPTKKTTIFTSVQTTCHQPLKKFHDQLKRLSILSSFKNIFLESAIYYEKCLKNRDIKPSYNINNQKKTIKTKRKENATLFGSIHHTASL